MLSVLNLRNVNSDLPRATVFTLYINIKFIFSLLFPLFLYLLWFILHLSPISISLHLPHLLYALPSRYFVLGGISKVVRLSPPQ